MAMACRRRLRHSATSKPSAVTISGMVSMLMSFIFQPSVSMSCSRPALVARRFLADAELLFLEAFDLARLIVGQQRTAALRLAGLQPAQRGFGLFQLFLQLFFLGAQLCVGVTPQFVDPVEGPRVRGTTANADEVVAAAQVVDGIPDELAVVGDRLQDDLAEEIALPHPHVVGQHVGVGDHHDVERLGRSLQRIGRRRDTGGRAIREGGRRIARHAHGDHLLAARLEAVAQRARIGRHAHALRGNESRLGCWS